MRGLPSQQGRRLAFIFLRLQNTAVCLGESANKLLLLEGTICCIDTDSLLKLFHHFSSVALVRGWNDSEDRDALLLLERG